jgi:hypothetical protein
VLCEIICNRAAADEAGGPRSPAAGGGGGDAAQRKEFAALCPRPPGAVKSP